MPLALSTVLGRAFRAARDETPLRGPDAREVADSRPTLLPQLALSRLISNCLATTGVTRGGMVAAAELVGRAAVPVDAAVRLAQLGGWNEDTVFASVASGPFERQDRPPGAGVVRVARRRTEPISRGRRGADPIARAVLAPLASVSTESRALVPSGKRRLAEADAGTGAVRRGDAGFVFSACGERGKERHPRDEAESSAVVHARLRTSSDNTREDVIADRRGDFASIHARNLVARHAHERRTAWSAFADSTPCSRIGTGTVQPAPSTQRAVLRSRRRAALPWRSRR